MKVLVTGSNGLIGKEVVIQLLEKDYEVVSTDLQKESLIKGVEYSKCDIRDYKGLLKISKDCEAILHLAALPSPRFAPCQETFDINVMGTYNIYDIAEKLNIKRVIQASSVNAIGMTWNVGDFKPLRFPLDETQPSITTCPYSLSKQLGESIGEYYFRRSSISGTALRFPGVYGIGFLGSEKHLEKAKSINEFLDCFSNLDYDKREVLNRKVREKVLKFRRGKHLEYSNSKEEPSESELGEISKSLWEQYMWFRYMLWSHVDVRDAAFSFVLSLEADYEGFYPLFINDSVNFTSYDTSKLISLFYEGTSYMKNENLRNWSLISIDRAKEIIGYTPRYSIGNLFNR